MKNEVIFDRVLKAEADYRTALREIKAIRTPNYDIV